ncbi:MAG: rod shape-determining protein MreD [Cyclobacteriaceae bacterium]
MVRKIITGAVLIMAQVMILKDLELFQVAFCLPYVMLILLLPYNFNRVASLVVAFLIGLFIDMFYDTPGIHAAGCVLIAFIRPFWLDVTLSGSSSDTNVKLGLMSLGFQWFLTFALPLTFVHHFALFFIEAGGFGLFWLTIQKVFYSTLYSFVCMIIFQYIFSSSSRG